MLYKIHPVSRRFLTDAPSAEYVVEEHVFDWTSNLQKIAELCVEPSAIARACGFAAASNEKTNKAECAVYVISVEGLPVCKIGVSTCPTDRLIQLQGTHWADLSLEAVIWFPTRKSQTVEQSALKAASEMGCRLNGEWVALEAAETIELVLKAGRYHGVPACDSAMWMQNWQRRVHGLRSGREKRDAIMRSATGSVSRCSVRGI